MKFKRILLPTDFSETAHKALEQALLLSARFDAELTCCTPVYCTKTTPPSCPESWPN